jgi:hypothetical protein
MTNENKDKIIDRVIDFLHNKPLKSDMRIAAALIEELKLVKNCSIPDVVGRSEQLKAFRRWMIENECTKFGSDDFVVSDYLKSL